MRRMPTNLEDFRQRDGALRRIHSHFALAEGRGRLCVAEDGTINTAIKGA